VVKKLRRISRLDDLRPHYEITLHPPTLHCLR
jgi:hypothetical protein